MENTPFSIPNSHSTFWDCLLLHCIYTEQVCHIKTLKCSTNFAWPTTFEAAKSLITELKMYYDENPVVLLVFNCIGFIFLQTWCIPGTFFFNLFSGAVFGIFVGWPLCLIVSLNNLLLAQYNRLFPMLLPFRYFWFRASQPKILKELF